MVPPARGRVRAATGGGGGAARLGSGQAGGWPGGRPRSPGPGWLGPRPPPPPAPHSGLSAGRDRAATPAPGVGLLLRGPRGLFTSGRAPGGPPADPAAAPLFCVPAPAARTGPSAARDPGRGARGNLREAAGARHADPGGRVPPGRGCGRRRRTTTFPERRPVSAPGCAVCRGPGRLLPLPIRAAFAPCPGLPAAASDPSAPLGPSPLRSCPPSRVRGGGGGWRGVGGQWRARRVRSEMPTQIVFSKAKPRVSHWTVVCRAVVHAPNLRRREGIVLGLPIRLPSRSRAQGARSCLPPPTQGSSAPSGSAWDLPAPRWRLLDSPGTLPGGCCA